MKSIYIILLVALLALTIDSVFDSYQEKIKNVCMDYRLMGETHETCLTDGKVGE